MSFGDTTPILFELESHVTRWSLSGPSKWSLLTAFAKHLGAEPASLGIECDGRVVQVESYRTLGQVTWRRRAA